jgi:predicted RNase H-like HicB family nuclease
MKRYAIVVEDAGTNLAAYVPDLPGCVATGDSEEEVGRLIREAIALHLEGLAEDGLPIPSRRAAWSTSRSRPDLALKRTRPAVALPGTITVVARRPGSLSFWLLNETWRWCSAACGPAGLRRRAAGPSFSSRSGEVWRSASESAILGADPESQRAADCLEVELRLVVSAEAEIQFSKSGPRPWRSLRPTWRTGDATAGFVQRPAIPPRRSRLGCRRGNPGGIPGYRSAVEQASRCGSGRIGL